MGERVRERGRERTLDCIKFNVVNMWATHISLPKSRGDGEMVWVIYPLGVLDKTCFLQGEGGSNKLQGNTRLRTKSTRTN